MPAVIFDFDGTLADSFDYVLDYIAAYINRSAADVHHADYRGIAMRRMASKMGAHFWQLPALFVAGRRDMARDLHKIPIFVGIPELLRDLHANGYKLYVVSTNLRQNILDFLMAHDIEQYFDEVYGRANLLTKAPLLRRVIADNKLAKATTWYVGDEAGDVRSAHRAGLRAAAVTWGYNNLSRLQSTQPDILAVTPEELQKIMQAGKR